MSRIYNYLKKTLVKTKNNKINFKKLINFNIKTHIVVLNFLKLDKVTSNIFDCKYVLLKFNIESYKQQKSKKNSVFNSV
jgi:hypothetical protein